MIEGMVNQNDQDKKDAERYRKVRKMTVRDFTNIFRWNLDGNKEWKTFDELIDSWRGDGTD